jgi:uncharacterized protein
MTNLTNTDTSHSTIVATAYPTAGKEREWETAIGNLIRTSMTFPGYKGSIFLKPESTNTPNYRLITNFDNDANMRRWYDSPERQACVVELSPFQQRPADIEYVSEYEFWLTPPESSNPHPQAPPKYKTFVVVWLALYLTVLPVYAVIRPFLIDHFPLLVTNAVLTAIGVAMMTWGVLPILNRWLRRWLYPTK